ncbi:MAG: hypothetical protein LAN37_06965 [Acidobacteriia bacterium]|nr:hypothetical protein [Terriglobia bacterium]
MKAGLISLTLAMLGFLWPMPQAQQRGAAPRPTTRSPHGALSINCDNCHTNTAWKPIRNIPEFDHNRTRYPLRGMHERVSCRQCHTSLVFSSAPTKCADCHADIHRRQFGANCEQCHTVKGWMVSIQQIRQHDNRFPLIGVHATVECDACHKNAAAGRFEGLSTDCYSCHQKDFANKAFDHRAMGFPTTCQTCHSMDTWLGAKFDHARFTGFALTGMHATLDCTSCHVNGRFQGTPATCYGCHSQDFLGTTNPNHAKAGFPRDCGMCHSTATWLNAKFDHTAFTGFPLTGMHATVPCQQCHVNGNYNLTSTACSSCHINDYNGATSPNHKVLGFPTDCSICHTTSGWTPATFNHAATGFALTGVHATLACVSCHVNGNFTNLGTTCVSCHLTNYNNTTNPNHKAAGFPTDCAVCHSTSAWHPASFNHNLTPFPLTGAHVNVACASCHVNGQFAGTPTDCFSCHAKDYNSVTNPNHVAAHFPTTCGTCHNTATWLGATFNHTWFPIYSGAHAGQWMTCNDCHVNPSNFAVFSCITCHAHDASVVNPKHTEVGSYNYNATSCYSCHPTGQGGG